MSSTTIDRLSAPTSRIPGPDLARGMMLLLIVLANTTYYLIGADRSAASAHPTAGSTLDAWVQGLLIATVDLRVYPMFAFLFGYGLVLIHRRHLARTGSEACARRLVQRRNLWLIAFGAVHAVLLWGGDILGAYGLTGLVIVWLFLRRADRTLLTAAGIGAALLTLLAAASAVEIWAVGATDYVAAPVDPGLTAIAYASTATPDYWVALLDRITMWPVQTLVIQGLVGLVVPVSILLGIWAARRQILERPDEYRRLLWSTAVGGITVGWAAGLFHALAHVGIITGLDSGMASLVPIQLATGLACGLGYVAVFGLLGGRLVHRPPGPITRSITAVGKRSMSGYLAQSVLCAPILAAWGFGLGAHLGSASMAGYAVVVWLITVVAAAVLERGDRPGPAEALLRRLTYRPDGRRFGFSASSALRRRRRRSAIPPSCGAAAANRPASPPPAPR